MRNERSKNILLGILVIGLVTMTIAYAALSTSLNIGNSDTEVSVKGGTWNIFFENGVASTPIGEGVSWVGSPTLTQTQIKGIQANFGLATQGSISYDFRIKNVGSINAKIIEPIVINHTCKINGNAVTSENDTAICNGISATLKYRDYVKGITSGEYEEAGEGVTMAQNDLLPSQSYVDAQLTITLVNNVQNRIPSGDMIVSFDDIDIVYGQTNESPNALVTFPNFGEGTTFTPSYYAYGNPTTSDVTEPTQNVFVGLDTSGNKGVCIKRSGKVHCFQVDNTSYEQQHVQEVFPAGTCSYNSSRGRWDCNDSDSRCFVDDGGVLFCSSNADDSNCTVIPNGDVICT